MRKLHCLPTSGFAVGVVTLGWPRLFHRKQYVVTEFFVRTKLEALVTHYGIFNFSSSGLCCCRMPTFQRSFNLAKHILYFSLSVCLSAGVPGDIPASKFAFCDGPVGNKVQVSVRWCASFGDSGDNSDSAKSQFRYYCRLTGKTHVALHPLTATYPPTNS